MCVAREAQVRRLLQTQTGLQVDCREEHSWLFPKQSGANGPSSDKIHLCVWRQESFA